MANEGGLATVSARPELHNRIATAQVDALFETVTLGTSGAALGAIILAATLYHVGYVNPQTGFPWAGYITGCAASHILLYQFYQRARMTSRIERSWAFFFTIFCLAEGIGWGWAPLNLATGNRLDVKLVVLIVTLTMGAGSIPAFSPYLPSFFAFFLPTTVPFLVASIASADPLQHAVYLLMVIFVCALGGLGVKNNRAFKQLIRLRIHAEALAADLERQKTVAEEANRAKSSFLAAASHDLRQPIHALGLFVGALRGVKMPPEGERLLDQIELSASAMDDLFTALLDISRLDAGGIEVNRRVFALQPILDRVCRDHAAEASAKDLRLCRVPCAALVDTDPVLLERILRNLVSNAVRHTSTGTVLVGCRHRGELLAVQVWDTGPGIAEADRQRIFEEYVQLGNPERDRAKGLGLGLAIVRRLAGLLDCKLELRSWTGRGSCFEISVPLTRGGAPVAAAPAEDLSLAPALVPRGRIVVIDDEAAIREAMSALLTSWGHEVVTAGSGEEAARRLAGQAARPDLIICDYRLRDGEDGIAVIERLRACHDEPIPAMLITGDTAPDRLAEAQASGFLLLHKPVPNSKLRAAIGNLL
jgi:signal transduction histidine kinase/CheY-like chemotaxis protein